jgi:hypothetical protein
MDTKSAGLKGQRAVYFFEANRSMTPLNSPPIGIWF